MSRHERLFNFWIFVLILTAAAPVFSAEPSSSNYSKSEAGLYQDVFDQAVYYEGTQSLHLERLYRDLFGKKSRALNVNVFDEVPDSTFFTNRHSRARMSIDALKKGALVTGGPASSGKWLITKGKFEGITPGFFIQDERGDRYLLKFDPLDYLELTSGAEVVASRFLHALGFNVPQYTLTYFKRDQLVIQEGAKAYDESGFRKDLTPERVDEFLLFVPETKDGSYRASASRILEGEILGPMEFHGRHREDPNDPVNHMDRREIRALQVFSSWLNNTDVRESNTLDVMETQEGAGQIRHYLIDFNSALGATPRGAKPPEFGHEHMLDYGQTLKAFLGFGLWEKPWQKRWKAAGEEAAHSSVGYFDNNYFNPGRYRTQLPYYPFKDLTRADGFWAAKLIMKFTDEEIQEIVSTGEYSDPKARDEIARTLIERRNQIGRFWFRQTNPLDEFRLTEAGDGSYELHFKDLAVHYQFEPEDSRIYSFDVIVRKGNRGIYLKREKIKTPPFSLRAEWLNQYPSLDLLIRAGQGPFVRVEIRSEDGRPRIAGIFHQD